MGKRLEKPLGLPISEMVLLNLNIGFAAAKMSVQF